MIHAKTAMIGKYCTPYSNEIGRSIHANAPAGPYALCELLQNMAAMIPAHTHESNHINGVHPHTIASEIAIGTLTNATANQDFRFGLISVNIRDTIELVKYIRKTNDRGQFVWIRIYILKFVLNSRDS